MIRCRICKHPFALELSGEWVVQCRRAGCRWLNHSHGLRPHLVVDPKPVRCRSCGHLLADHLDGEGKFSCRHCGHEHLTSPRGCEQTQTTTPPEPLDDAHPGGHSVEQPRPKPKKPKPKSQPRKRRRK